MAAGTVGDVGSRAFEFPELKTRINKFRLVTGDPSAPAQTMIAISVTLPIVVAVVYDVAPHCDFLAISSRTGCHICCCRWTNAVVSVGDIGLV